VETTAATRREKAFREEIMFATREQRLIVTMLSDGSPLWYVAAVTKSDRHQVYVLVARTGTRILLR
jgi:hypothetical protein